MTRYYEDETDDYTQNHYHLFHTHLFPGKVSLNTGLHLTTGRGTTRSRRATSTRLNTVFQTMYPSDPGIRSKRILCSGNGLITFSTVRCCRWSDRETVTEWTLGGALNRYDGDHFGRIKWMEYPGNVTAGYEWYRNNGLKDEFNVYGKVMPRCHRQPERFSRPAAEAYQLPLRGS